MIKKKVMSAINFLCTSCQKEHLSCTRVVKTDSEEIYFEFVCLDCGIVNTVEITAIMANLYTTPFAAESPLVH